MPGTGIPSIPLLALQQIGEIEVELRSSPRGEGEGVLVTVRVRVRVRVRVCLTLTLTPNPNPNPNQELDGGWTLPDSAVTRDPDDGEAFFADIR